jgi:hypothetical protein
MSRRKLDEEKVSEVFEDRRHSDGRRKIKLRANERHALVRQQRAEAAAALFLDLEVGRTWAEIAEELGLSPAQLRDLTKTDEFDAAYTTLFAELGHDPRFRAAQAAVGDLLPLAIRELKTLLTGPRTPAGVKLKAVEKVLALNGLSNSPPPHSDRQELAEFLGKHNLSLTQVNNFNVPPEYTERMSNFHEVFNGEVEEVSPPLLDDQSQADDGAQAGETQEEHGVDHLSVEEIREGPVEPSENPDK